MYNRFQRRHLRNIPLALSFLAQISAATVHAQDINLSQLGTTHPGFQISGSSSNDKLGYSVSGVGDVNGDGFADVIVGAFQADSSKGETYIVFGKPGSTTVNISTMGPTEGFEIVGINAGDQMGRSVSGAGDVNGDGLADLIVGAHEYNGSRGLSAVVFGKTDGDDVNLASLGSGGFAINGIDANDDSGISVSGAGDVNGDGLDDVIIGAYGANGGAGETYVVFGKSDNTNDVSLSSLGAQGFQINGESANDFSGFSVSGAGDINADGFDDLVIGAWRAYGQAGRTYVVFGSSSPSALNLSNLAISDSGFRIDGIAFNDYSGFRVSGAGDINGDGFADVVIGAFGSTMYSGEAYVVFGKTSSGTVSLSSLGSAGFRVHGSSSYDLLGYGVSGAGDVNGDGLDDILAGMPDGSGGRGNAYLILGKENANDVNIASLGSQGRRIIGASSGDFMGASVAGAGDINGDGLADLIVGADGRSGFAGAAFVVQSPFTAPSVPTWKGRLSAVADPPELALGLTGDGSNHGTPDSRCTVDFEEGDDDNGAFLASEVTVTRETGASVISNLPGALPVLWNVSTPHDDFTAVNVRFQFLDSEVGVADSSNLRLFRSDSPSGSWTQVASDIEADRNRVSARVDSLGYFAIAPDSTLVIDLAELGSTHPGFRIDGIDENDYSGFSVSGAGDVNGDGLADLIVGASAANSGAGESYVVFGKAASSIIDLGNLGIGGFRIDGIDSGDFSGFSVSGAGDVNGDGLADLIVGALFADPGGIDRAGENYVVFGKADDTPVNLVTLGAAGFRIDGIDANDSSGHSVSGAGDVNGDGLADLIVGAFGADPGGINEAGESYVIFGKADSSAIVLGSLGAGGFRIDGIAADDYSGRSVSGAGDVNGDGLADLIVGAFGADPGGSNAAGESYVIFGKSDSTAVNLDSLGDGGFRIDGIDSGDRSGRSVSGAGDVNGDGLADLIVGAERAGPGGNSRAGESFVVFGKTDTSTIDLESLGAAGFQIEGIDSYDYSGYSVSGAGDVNGDGLADLIVGAYRADPGGINEAGESYVIFGKADSSAIVLGSLGAGGFRIDGIAADDYSGRSVSGAGDVNGDGLADLIVGASQADPGDMDYAGESYVIFSPFTAPTIPTWKGFAKTGNAPALALGLTGDGSNDDTPDSRAWIDFEDGTGTGVADASLVTVTRDTDSFTKGDTSLPANGLPVVWEVTTERTGWTSAEVTFAYLESDLSTQQEDRLKLFGSNSPTGPWTQLSSKVDTNRNRVSGAVSEFGFFAIAPDSTLVIDLAEIGSTHPGFRIDGIDENDRSGRSVSGAGDVNGDGLADLIVGAFGANSGAGESYVVFGKADPTVIDLGSLGTAGFRIDGIDSGDFSGISVSGAGDVNGDGLADLIVGARFADSGGTNGAGESYVVFGKTDDTPVNLATLGAGGFRIDGIDANDYSGLSVSGAGDVNGDGLADLIVGALGADPGGTNRAGESYVVFGKADGTTVNLATLGAGGFRIDGIDTEDTSGRSVSGAGDVNGDGLADLIVGALGADPGGTNRAGESYVVFGKADGATVNLATLGDGGFRIDGIDPDDRSGGSVSGAGDVNGDGLADLIVGADGAVPDGNFRAGESYVVFGKAGDSPINLATLGDGGFRIGGIDPSDYSGYSVSGAGDVNGDGLADLIVGASDADPGGDRNAGESYVVFGKADNSTIDLGNLGASGIRLDGIDPDDRSGVSVSGAGDVNGDGLADLIVGAFLADPGGDSYAGESYVIFSPFTAPAIPTWKGFAKTGNAPALALGLTGDGSNDDTPDSRSWIDFEDGTGTGLANASLVTVTRDTDSFTKGSSSLPENGLPVVWEVTTDRTGWTSAEVTFAYLESDLSTQQEDKLKLFGATSPTGPWTQLSSKVDTNRNRVSGAVSEFGFFAIATDQTLVIDLAELGSTHPGFRIDGISEGDYSSFSVSGAGDVNGDGLADLIVGAYLASPGGRNRAGESYVVFGKVDSAVIDLGNLGAGGFRIEGNEERDYSGISVSGAGDVNGDGLADLIVGASYADPGGRSGAGESYVVFGKTDGATVNLQTLGDGGFRIDGIDTYDFSGRSVSGAGDVNGDGLADLIVGAHRADPGGNNSAGESYVIFGKSDNMPVNLYSLGDGGFRIDGIDFGDQSGRSVSGAGDVNGDGLADLIVGAPSASSTMVNFTGASYVIFGKTGDSPVDLGNLGAGGFRIDGIDPGDRSGRSVSGAGDVNGDGLADLIVEADGAGESLVIFGKADSSVIDPGSLGFAGFRIVGIELSDFFGFSSVSGAGDVNGDGLSDLIVGAFEADPGGISNAGQSYVIYGKADSSVIDLENLGIGGFRIDGIDQSDKSGISVSGAGDVNGDGLADLIVGAYTGDPGGNSDAGEGYVIFSPSTAPAIPTWKGFAKTGNAPALALGLTGDGSNDDTPDSRVWIDFEDGTGTGVANASLVTVTRDTDSFTKGSSSLPENALPVLWQVTTDRTGWTSAEVTFHYLESELGNAFEQQLRLFKADSAEGPFTELTSALDADRNQISATVDSMSFFAIIPVNSVPIADDQMVSTDEDVNLAITLTGSDLETPNLTFTIQDGPSDGVLTGNAPNVIYDPNPDFIGNDSFTFFVNDGEDDSELATVSITVNDASQPTVQIMTSAPDPTNEEFVVSVSFSESVMDFELDDISVTNGNASELTETGIDSTQFTFLVTPMADGQVSISIPMARVTDASGNQNTASNSLFLNFDGTSPGVILSTLGLTVTGSFSVDAEFSEMSFGFELSDINITNGMASNLQSNGNDFSFTITPENEGDISLSIPSGVATDEAGNENSESNTLTVTFTIPRDIWLIK